MFLQKEKFIESDLNNGTYISGSYVIESIIYIENVISYTIMSSNSSL